MYIYLKSGMDLLTPWMDRQADNAMFTSEVVNVIAGAASNLGVSIVHKNTEDTGPGEEVEESPTWATLSGNYKEYKVLGLKQKVRYRIRNATGSSELVVRMHAPVWFDTPAT